MKQATGRELTIDGLLSWSFFPSFGIELGRATLSNPPGFDGTYFAQVKKVTIGVKLLPLLHKRFESDGLKVDGLVLNFVKNVRGEENWQQWKNDSHSLVDTSEHQSTETGKSVGSVLLIKGVTLSDGTIHYENRQNKQRMDVTKLKFVLKNVDLQKPFPIQWAFKFLGKNPSVSGETSMTGMVSLSLSNQKVSLNNVDIAAMLRLEGKVYDARLHGDLLVDGLNHELHMNLLRGESANLKMTGKIAVTNFETEPKIMGQMNFSEFDGKKWLKATKQDLPILQELSGVSGGVHFSGGVELQKLNLEGNVHVKDVRISDVRMNNMRIPLRLQKGILSILPLSTSFYEGTLENRIEVNLIGSVPRIVMNMQMQNIKVGGFFSDLAPHSKMKLKGEGNISLQCVTQGGDNVTILKNLNGTGQLDIKNGVLTGIDIPYLVHSSYHLVDHQSVSQEDTHQTEFKVMASKILIQNGVMKNDDFSMDTSVTLTQGNGQVDLVNQLLDYRLITKLLHPPNTKGWINLYRLSIPIQISGHLNDPKVSVDTVELLKSVAVQRLEQETQNVVEKLHIDKAVVDMLPQLLGK